MKTTRVGTIVIGLVLSAGVAQAQQNQGRVRGISGVISGERAGDPLANRTADRDTRTATATAPATPTTPAPAAATGTPLAPNEERFGVAITIRGTPEFRAKIKADLETLRRTRTGAALLAALDQAGKPVSIAFGMDGCLPLSDAAYAAGTTLAGRRVTIDRPGAGSGSRLTVRREDDPCYPPVTTLGHELIHALHNAQGRNLKQLDYTAIDPGTANHEEAKTIGLGAYAQEQLTDNALRRELGNRSLPQRRSHAGECRG